MDGYARRIDKEYGCEGDSGCLCLDVRIYPVLIPVSSQILPKISGATTSSTSYTPWKITHGKLEPINGRGVLDTER
jgi:hypothetical protein